ncbi:MAG: peroxide stress protein YaaA [Magnetococcales bacterium]|nr:peroxide stress protein YaaA [Magnetococcales bacterium]
MLALISPAKTLDPHPKPLPVASTQPFFQPLALELVEIMRGFDAPALQTLMNISPALARLNADRFQNYLDHPTPTAGHPAAQLYRGDTYTGLDVDSWSPDDWHFAQDHLRILTGLYGLLRPLDRIQPYRLEMGTRLATPRGKDLYAFWGKRLIEVITQEVAAHANPTVINLASEEYAKAVAGLPMVTPIFKEERRGGLQVIGLMAKRARGAMARHLITHRLETPDPLQGFTAGGYRYRPELSDPTHWIFTRPQVAATP